MHCAYVLKKTFGSGAKPKNLCILLIMLSIKIVCHEIFLMDIITQHTVTLTKRGFLGVDVASSELHTEDAVTARRPLVALGLSHGAVL